jgi:hypothetical protein
MTSVVDVSGSSVVTSTPPKLAELVVVDNSAPLTDTLTVVVDTPVGNRSLLCVPGRVVTGAPLPTLNACVLTGRSSRANDGVVLVVSVNVSTLPLCDALVNSRLFITDTCGELVFAGTFVDNTLFVGVTRVLLVVVDDWIMLLPLVLLLLDADDSNVGDAPVNPGRPDSFDLPPALFFVDGFVVVALLPVCPNDDDDDDTSGEPK